MFPVSHDVSAGTGDATGLTESQVRNIVTGYGYITAASTNPVVAATSVTSGFWDVSVFKNATVIVPCTEQYLNQGCAYLNIDAPSTDPDEYSFVVINTGTVPLKIRNLNNTNVVFVSGIDGTYVYGSASRNFIQPRRSMLLIHVKDTHNPDVVQPAGGPEEVGQTVDSFYEYLL